MLGSNIILCSLFTSEPSCPENCIKITTLPGFSSLSFENLTFQSHGQPIHNIYHVVRPLPCSVFLNQYISYMFPYKNLSSGGQWESIIASVMSKKDPRKNCSLWLLGNPLHPLFQTSCRPQSTSVKKGKSISKWGNLKEKVYSQVKSLPLRTVI